MAFVASSERTGISLKSVDFVYPNGVQALCDTTLEIPQGARVAIVGQNGCGKTTLAKHLNGLLHPTRGDVLVGEWNTRHRTVAQMSRRVGLVFQNPDDQIFQSRVLDEVAFGLVHSGLSRAEIGQRVERALEQTGLGVCLETHPYELLPSQRKWLALACVLALDPAVIVLDEPTMGQDIAGLVRLDKLLGSWAELGKTVILITHDIDFCAEHADRIVVMKGGQVIADGPKQRVLANAESLGQTFLEPPQVSRLGAALGLPPPMTVHEFVKELALRTNGRRQNNPAQAQLG